MDLRIFTEPQQGASYDDLLAVAQATERLGFDAFFRSDHYQRIGEGSGLPGPTDAWVTLGALARETSSIRLGTLVSPATFRLPGPLAITVAQVDAMSGGRVELGLGAGWYDGEHAAYGIPFPASAGERFDRLTEQLEIVTGLWATPDGATFSYDGAHHRLVDAPALPKPVQRPGPPIIIGGWGAVRTPALAARFAAEWNLFGDPDTVGERRGRVLAACEASDRDPASIVASFTATVCCGADEAELTRRAAAIGRSVDDLRTHGVAGTPDEVVAGLRRYADVGCTRGYLQVLDLADLDHLELLAAEVLPTVKEW